jgi:hypothetical protein
MSHKHRVVLQKIFAHPIASNLDWKKLSSTLKHFGAEINLSNNNHAHIVINGKELIISMPHHGHEINNKTDVTKLRHFLEEVGVTPKESLNN